MSNLATRMGETSKEFVETISKERIDAFSRAVAGKAPLASPPTLFTVFRSGEFELLEKFKIPLSRVLHGEQEYGFSGRDYLASLPNGIRFQTKLANYREKKGEKGSLHFIVFETIFRAESGAQIGFSKTTMVVKGELS